MERRYQIMLDGITPLYSNQWIKRLSFKRLILIVNQQVFILKRRRSIQRINLRQVQFNADINTKVNPTQKRKSTIRI